jgi:hypothetical protein
MIRILMLFLGLVATHSASAGPPSPAWSRHCVVPAIDFRDDADRTQLQAAVARCTAHDACLLACRASSCADRVDVSCEADCRREDPLAMARLADRWTERRCSPGFEDIAYDWWDTERVDAVLAAGLGDLAHQALPDGATEVRIWAFSGPFARQPMLRLRRSARGVVTGELYILYPADWAMEGNADGRDLRRFMRANCRSIAMGADQAICHARFAREPRWTALYRRFEGLGLLTLPDQDDLPKSIPPHADCTNPDEPCELDELVISDGSGMDVEVRQGSTYRRYGYDQNGAQGRESASVDVAFEIIDVVLRLHWTFDER